MATPKPIELDLCRDLPKVRKHYADLIEKIGLCYYSTPCAVGVMMTARQRNRAGVRDNNSLGITYLIELGIVSVPAGQARDFDDLQRAFDRRRKEEFDMTLTALESKYLTVSA